MLSRMRKSSRSKSLRTIVTLNIVFAILSMGSIVGPTALASEAPSVDCSAGIILEVADDNPYDIVSGTVTGVNPDQVQVVVFVRTDGWYVQPYADYRAYLQVNSDGSYQTWIRNWRQISAFVIRKDYNAVSEQDPYSPFPLAVDCLDVLAMTAHPALKFSGYEWAIKSGDLLGPGPNHFSSSSDNVWVDDAGRLHLKTTYFDARDTWYCAEAYLMQSLGYGKYTFYLSSRVDQLDKMVIGSPFIYQDANHELDVEFSRWNIEDGPNAQFVVQPHYKPGHREQFYMSLAGDLSTHIIDWKPNSVWFQSAKGHTPHPPQEQILHEWPYSEEDVPAEENELVHINLWLFNGQAPSDGQEAEIIVEAFTWTARDDLNGDGVVNEADLVLFVSDFGRSDCGRCYGDLDGDRDADGSDMVSLAAAFNNSE